MSAETSYYFVYGKLVLDVKKFFIKKIGYQTEVLPVYMDNILCHYLTTNCTLMSIELNLYLLRMIESMQVKNQQFYIVNLDYFNYMDLCSVCRSNMFHNLPPCALVSSVFFLGFYFLGEQFFFFSNCLDFFLSRFFNVSKQD